MRATLWICLFVLLLGCSRERTDRVGSSAGGQGRLKGQVVAPLEGVQLHVYRQGDDLSGPAIAVSSLTGSDGVFSLDLPDGDYVGRVRENKDGVTDESGLATKKRSRIVKISIKEGTPAMVIVSPSGDDDKRRSDEQIAKKSGVSGQIFDSDGRPMEGVRIHVYDHVQMSERPKFVSEKTGPDGRYLITLPAGGTYYIAARDKYGGPPKLGDLYGRYDFGTIEPAAVVVREGEVHKDVNITVSKVW